MLKLYNLNILQVRCTYCTLGTDCTPHSVTVPRLSDTFGKIVMEWTKDFLDIKARQLFTLYAVFINVAAFHLQNISVDVLIKPRILYGIHHNLVMFYFKN